MNNYSDLKDIVLRVTNTGGFPLEVVVPFESTIDEWERIFKLVLGYLEYSVDSIEINRESVDD